MNVGLVARGIFFAALALGLTTNAAANVQCVGTVNSSYVLTDGTVRIVASWRNDHTTICDMNTDWNGITPDVCLAWLAKIDAAVSLNKSLVVHYYTASDCATLPVYGSSVAPNFVMLLNT